MGKRYSTDTHDLYRRGRHHIWMVPLLFLVVVNQLMLMQTLIVTAITLKPTIVVHIKGGGVDRQLYTATRDLFYVDWVVVEDDLNASILSGVKMLLLMRTDEPTNYTTEELDAIVTWFSQGGKTIWVGGDCDGGTDQDRLAVANSALEKIGSALRIESSFVEDPSSCVERHGMVLGVSKNCDKEFGFLVSGVNRTLFQGAGAIIGYLNQTYFSLEWPKPRNIYRIMTTTENGVIRNNMPPEPEVHRPDGKGTFLLLAIEIDEEKRNSIIVSGDRPFSNKGDGMYKPELSQEYPASEYPQQGALLFENLVKYGINRHPVCNMNGPYSGEEGRLIFFNSSGSADQDGIITEYRWDFGDGTGYSYSANPNHTYLKPGTYKITLTVTDDLRGVGSQTTLCTVTSKQKTDDGILSFPIEKVAPLLTLGGAIVGVVGWILKTRADKKRKEVLFIELLEGIDSIYSRYKMNARNCEVELYKMKTQILNEFKQGMLGKEKYDILNQRIENYIKEIQKEISHKEG